MPYDVQPGLCVIINNTEFTRGASPLPQGKKDEKSLHVLFKTLGFDLKIHQNLTAQEMIHRVQSYSKIQHEGVFFLIILSHGALVSNKEVVLGTDCKPVEIHELETFFHASNCHSLYEVPKIFLIDACRGDKKESAFKPQRTCGMAKHLDPSLPGHASTAPGTDSADFAILYASTYGNVAYVTKRGSQLTQTFVKVTSEASLDKTFIDIIQEVQTRIRASNFHQTVELVNRLNQPYYIKRFVSLNSGTLGS